MTSTDNSRQATTMPSTRVIVSKMLKSSERVKHWREVREALTYGSKEHRRALIMENRILRGINEKCRLLLELMPQGVA